VPALAVDAQLAGRLRAAQHQQPSSTAAWSGTPSTLEIVFVARGAPAAGLEHQGQVLELVERLLGFGIAELHQRLAAGLLVAARDHGVELSG
jgi:hypothetical protein